MGKKKEIKKETPAINNLAIQGNVNLTIKSGKRVVKKVNLHNTATMNLLYGLIVALGGGNQSNCLPKYISAGTGVSSGDNVTRNNLVNEISMVRPLVTVNYKGPTKDPSKGIVSSVYQAIIPYEYIGSLTITELGLFGTETGASLVTYISVNPGITLQAGQSLIIEWSFSMQNVGKDSSTTSTSSDSSI